MEELLEILNEINSDIDYENETALIDDGILDSLDVVALVSELNDHYDIEIGLDDLIPENFNSLEAMLALIEKLK
ncbi:MAG: acyl carrier protein [Erysipelotrichaceae bacterium]|jgi:acyl carrier protein|nr:acyl carrier protein [Erysipelotrichaceae bacterium]